MGEQENVKDPAPDVRGVDVTETPANRTFLASAVLAVALAAIQPVTTQERRIDDFFGAFTDEWVRMNPNQATAARYFTGPEQDALETQLTPQTREWGHRRVELARRGLADLKKFDRDRLTRQQRLSADLMQWQLEMIVEGEKYEDFAFPLEQFGGANIDLVNALTVVHPLTTEKDAVSYVARLGLVGARMEEATAEALRLSEKRMAPPRFIVRATLTQMRQFVSTPAAQNPFVTAFADRMAAAGGIPETKRNELRAAAERITAAQVYPAWRNAIAVLEPLADQCNGRCGAVAVQGRRGRLRVQPAAIHDHQPVSRTRSTRSACARWRGSRRRWTPSCGARADGRLGKRPHRAAREGSGLSGHRGGPHAHHGRHRRRSCATPSAASRRCSTACHARRSSPGRSRASARRPPPPATACRRGTDLVLARSRFRYGPRT